MDGGTRHEPLGSEHFACSRHTVEPPHSPGEWLSRPGDRGGHAAPRRPHRPRSGQPAHADGELVTAADTGAAIGGTEGEQTRLRIFFEFIRGADEAGTSALDLIVKEPALIGDQRFDALLGGAAAEYIAARWGRPGPLWSVSIERFLDTAWWVSDLPSERAFAAVWPPAPFRRRGIYLDRHDLTNDGVHVMPEPVFNRTDLQRAFSALAAKLQHRGVVDQVHVVGGAAMLLAYDPRVTTRNIDALFSPDAPMLKAIREVAEEMGWPRTWINNQPAATSPGHLVKAAQCSITRSCMSSPHRRSIYSR